MRGHLSPDSSAYLVLSAVVLLGALPSTGCQDPPLAPVVPLVTVPVEDRASLALQPPTAEEAADASAPKAPAVQADRPLGAAAFASAEDIAAFEEACGALQPAGQELGAARTGGLGEVYRGAEPPPDLGPPPADGTFIWAEGDPEFLDPNFISESSGTMIGSQMFEGLLAWAPGNAPPRPALAERFEVSEDGRTYTFHLRKGLVWSDGVPLTAEDLRWSWMRGLDPGTGSKNAQQLWYIQGAQAFHEGKVSDPTTVGIEVVDPLTLRVILRDPTPYFPDLVAYIAYAPVPRHAVEAHEKQWVRPENIVVSGPYTMTSWTPRDRLGLAKNPRYWDADSVSIDKAVVLFSDSEEMMTRFYDTGQCHWIRPLPTDKVREWIEAGRSDLHIDQQMCTYYYHFRVDNPPFDDPLVRRALNMAIDKERLTRHVLASRQVPATHLLSDMFTSMMGYRPVEGDAFDPRGAKELLAEAGYPGGVGLPPIEIIYNTYESHRLIAEFVQRNLKDNLGLEVAVHNMEWRSLLKLAQSGQFQIVRMSWCADYPDPMTFLEVFHSKAENNYAAYLNPAYDRLLVRIKGETDPRARNVLICAAEKVLNRDVPLLTFYFYTRSYLLRDFVEGFEAQYQDHHLLRDLSIRQGTAPVSGPEGGGGEGGE